LDSLIALTTLGFRSHLQQSAILVMAASVQGCEAYEDFLTKQLDTLKSTLVAHHQQLFDGKTKNEVASRQTRQTHTSIQSPLSASVSEVDEELLRRSPRTLMELLDSEPTKFLEETLPIAPLERWSDFYLQLRSRGPTKQLRQATQLTILDAWTRKLTLADKKKNLRRTQLARRPSLTLGDKMFDESWLWRKIALLPHGNLRLAWTFFGLLAICWDLIFIPLQMFDINEQVDNLINVMSIVVFIYWMLDVPATFITGFDRGGILEMRMRAIAQNYIRGWLMLDLIVLFLDVIIFVVLSTNAASQDGGSDSMGSFRLARALRLMRFLRLLRLHKMANLAAEILDRFKTDSFLLTMNILRSLAAVLALNHYMSCCFLGIAVFAEEDGEMTWIEIAGLEKTDFWTQYLSALHWSLTQFMPATNNIAPNTAEERVFAIFVVLLGLAVFSSFVSGVTNTVNQLRQIHTEHFKQESRMKSFLTQKSVSVDVWCRVQKFCRLRILLDKISLKEADIPMLKDLPQGLRVKLHQEIYMPTLISARWMSEEFLELDEPLMLKLCDGVLKEKVATATQDIFMEGGECREVVIPTKTERDPVYTSSGLGNIERIEQDTWLCELCLWTKWEYRGSLEACDVTHYMVIPGEEFSTTIASAGGRLFQLIRTIGLLYIAVIEAKDSKDSGEDTVVTDLPIAAEKAEDMRERAARFGQLRLIPRKASGSSLQGLGSIFLARRSSYSNAV